MENKDIIKFKYEQGVYDLQDLLLLVEYKDITKQEFFEITRFKYESLVEW